ncbi:hypothetical protein [Streptomyces sp. A012304]|uniref:hypothetical protein n=1 Tax=Streptomyces sp. A012304 TaxID=375446 RepID=UPI0022327CEF|nr:hypothetical protein [Streptomyces sp. A012304]GKQ40602.1 hypothetical protein ALMP_71250 [Streptomyces sp. A012304]
MNENGRTPAEAETEEAAALDHQGTPDPAGRLGGRLRAVMGMRPVLIAGMVMGMAVHSDPETISTALL